jgi:Ser/Thr protein kinase RdoA (MazF antagonist)
MQPDAQCVPRYPPATMGKTEDVVPRFDAEQAAAIADRHYGLSGTFDPLPSYIDQNFRLTTTAGERWVLKIAQSEMARAQLEARIGALIHLQQGAAGHWTPPVRPTVAGEHLIKVDGDAGRCHLVHMVRYLHGRPLGAGEHPPALLVQVGRLVAEVAGGLEGFSHPTLEPAHRWDLRRATEILTETHRIRPARRRLLAERYLERFADQVVPQIATLPAALLHCDANEQNILVRERDGEKTVSALIDFGDLVHSCRVFEPAITAAYACLGHSQPLVAIATVVAGFHHLRPLSDRELDAVFPAVCARLAVSVTMSTKSRDERPDNTYANVSERTAWQAMEGLADIATGHAREHLVRACR